MLSGTEVVIGRSPFSTLCVNHPKLSRVHASFQRVGDQLLVRDLGSSNGTFVDGVRLGPAPVVVTLQSEIRLAGVAVVLEEVEFVSSGRFRTGHPDEPSLHADTETTTVTDLLRESKK